MGDFFLDDAGLAEEEEVVLASEGTEGYGQTFGLHFEGVVGDIVPRDAIIAVARQDEHGEVGPLLGDLKGGFACVNQGGEEDEGTEADVLFRCPGF